MIKKDIASRNLVPTHLRSTFTLSVITQIAERYRTKEERKKKREKKRRRQGERERG